MKRIFTTLFFAVALLTATTASAEVLFEYNFNNTDTWTSFSYAGGNTGQTYGSYSDESFDSSTGLVALVGNVYPYFDNWKTGTTLVDLGKEIGQVLCLSGSSSIINGLLKNSLGEGLDSITGGCTTQWGNLIFYLSDELTPSSTTAASEIESDPSKIVKITVELNLWDSSSSSKITEIYATNPDGNDCNTAVSVGGSDFLSGSAYDPTKYMKYVFYGWSSKEITARIKMGNTGTNWTLFIKSVTFETVDEAITANAATTSNETYGTWTLSYTDTDETSHKCIFRTNNYDDNWVIVDNSGISTSTEFTITIGGTTYSTGSSLSYDESYSLSSVSSAAATRSTSGGMTLSDVAAYTYTVFNVRASDDGYTLTVVGTNSKDTTGITELSTDDRSVVSERYYNLSGVQVAEPVDGLRNIYIVVRSYDDGTTDAVKVIR